jgi:hypothetical protein
VAKFFPRYNGPYDIIDMHLATSNYTLELPNSPNTYPTYHTSELKLFVPNDSSLFPSHKLAQLLPTLTPDGVTVSLAHCTLSESSIRGPSRGFGVLCSHV